MISDQPLSFHWTTVSVSLPVMSYLSHHLMQTPCEAFCCLSCKVLLHASSPPTFLQSETPCGLKHQLTIFCYRLYLQSDSLVRFETPFHVRQSPLMRRTSISLPLPVQLKQKTFQVYSLGQLSTLSFGPIKGTSCFSRREFSLPLCVFPQRLHLCRLCQNQTLLTMRSFYAVQSLIDLFLLLAFHQWKSYHVSLFPSLFCLVSPFL